MAKWNEAVVLRIDQQSPNTRLFTLKVLDDFLFHFEPGQFITLDLPIHEKRRLRLRSYSIANIPNKDNILQLSITLLKGGAGTTYLFNEVKKGHILTFKGPEGAFTLPKELPSKLVFICTGTGIVPFRSMLKYLAQENRTDIDVHLIFGTRYKNGMLFKEEMSTYQNTFSQFRYSVALSREQHLPKGQNPDIHQGYIHAIYQKEYRTNQKNTKFFLCGWSGMVDEAIANLKEMGYQDKDIYYELYG